jgi:hypothetical protein
MDVSTGALTLEVDPMGVRNLATSAASHSQKFPQLLVFQEDSYLEQALLEKA